MSPVTKRYLIDLVERVASTFGEAFFAAWYGLGDLKPDQLLTMTNLKVGVAAGAAAVGKGFLARRAGNRNSASLAPKVP